MKTPMNRTIEPQPWNERQWSQSKGGSTPPISVEIEDHHVCVETEAERPDSGGPSTARVEGRGCQVENREILSRLWSGALRCQFHRKRGVCSTEEQSDRKSGPQIWGPGSSGRARDPTQQGSPSVNKSTPTHTYIHIYKMKYCSAMKKNEAPLCSYMDCN